MYNDYNENSGNLEYNSIDTGAQNADYNTVNTTYSSDNNGFNTDNNTNLDDVYKPSTSFDSTTYNSSNDDEKSKRPIIFTIIIIIVILLILGILGFFGYKYLFSKTNSSDIDSIIVEGGSLNPVFSIDNEEYTVESLNESIKLICTYKGKKVNNEGCNKSIVLNNNSPITQVIKSNKKEYKFNIVQINSDSPIINNVSGNDAKDWTKKVTLTVDATFKKEKNKESYSFDGGKTFQESNTKEITSSGDVLIVVRDSENNMSSIYTEKVEMVDSTAPTFDVSISNKIATISVKDSESGVTNLMVTESSDEPSNFTSIDLTKETIIRYTAIKDGVFYAWAKDKAGNIRSEKFTIGNATNSSKTPNNNSNGNNNNNNNNQIPSISETITITGVKTNTSSWTNSVVVTINAKSNKSGTLIYSFDGGKTYQNSNSKTFNSNMDVVAVVKNNSTGKISNSVVKKISNIDVTPPNCASVEGASVEWTKDSRNISVLCSDSGSGCKVSKVTKNYNTTTKTAYISIYDNAGNKKDCPVNVYVDKTAPLLTYEMFLDSNPKKFQLFITDNESGIDLNTVKYKEKILKNGIDNIWHGHDKFDGSKEINASNGIEYQYRFTKKIGVYKYFTITASDKLGNTSEIQISVKD